MYSEGHWGIGLLTYAPIAFLLLFINEGLWPFAVLGIVIVSVTCTLPDIDMWLKDIWFLPIRHRGITHTVWFALATGLVLGGATLAVALFTQSLINTYIAMTTTDAYLTAVYTGVMGVYGTLSHLLGDVITPTGLRPLQPLRDTRYRYVFTVLGEESKAANKTWNWFFYVAGVIALFLAFILGSELARSTLAGYVFG